MTEIRTAEREAPSKPYLTDDWTPTDPRLWEKVLMVAKGRRRQMTRVGPNGPRTIHAPHHGRGFRHWPNPKAVAWAVKQYNGYGGKWKGRDEDEAVTASEEGSPLHHHLLTLKGEIDAQTHTLRDVVEGRVQVGVEGDSGKDILLARKLGLFTCNVAGVDIFARCEEDARPLIHYLERGGMYGSLEFSSLLGYTADELELYRRYLLLSAEMPHPDQLNAFQRTALERVRFGSVLTIADESNENLWMIDLERRGLVALADASIVREEGYWEITAGGERFMTASLGSELENRMKGLLSGTFDPNEARRIAEWLAHNFRFKSPRTPKGQKDLKEKANKLWWFLANGSETSRETILDTWKKIEPRVESLVRYFTDEGGTVVADELKLGLTTYYNKAGLDAETLEKYARRLETLWASVHGWRAKAFAGGLKVAFASPRDFNGTATGKYKRSEDALYVRTTSHVLKRDAGYAGFDYILIHELGHRYEAHNHLPEDFDQPKWWTSKYSQKEGEGFAELFAIGHFGLTGTWDPAVVGRFEKVMG